MRRVALPLASLTCLALTVSAQAQISFLDLFQSATYTQNSNNAPAVSTAILWTCDSTTHPPVISRQVPSPAPVRERPQRSAPIVLQTWYLQAACTRPGGYEQRLSYRRVHVYRRWRCARHGKRDAGLYGRRLPFCPALPHRFGLFHPSGCQRRFTITAHFSPFAVDPSVNDQFQFFTIFDPASNTFVYDAGFLPQSATSVTIAANTLQAGHNYIYELIDSNRVLTTGTGGQFAPQLGFDLRTSGAFFTAAAVPEPGSIALFAGMGAVGAGFLRRRKQARKAV